MTLEEIQLIHAKTVQSEAETALVAADIGALLRVGDVLLLEGTLGAGKTAFSRALIRGLADDPNLLVPSPTFTFSQIYELPTLTLTHFDLYRMGEPEEVFDLGWDDACVDGAVLVEWPVRLGAFKPPAALHVHIDLVEGSDESRTLRFIGNEAWQKRLS